MGRKFYLAFLVLISWFALILQFRITLNNAPASGFPASMVVTNYFSYFTILSNILVALATTFMVVAPVSIPGRFFGRSPVQAAIAVYIFIVGLVYNLVLRKIWSPEGWQLVADNLLHVAVPLGYTLYALIYIPPKSLRPKLILPWLVFPALYLAYSLIRGNLADWYPYPFLDAGKLGYGKVAVNAFFVLLSFLITGFCLIGWNRFAKNPK